MDIEKELAEIDQSFKDILYADRLEKYLIGRLGTHLLTSLLTPRLEEIKNAKPHCGKLIEAYEDIARKNGINLPFRG